MYTYAYSHSHTGLNSATIATVQPQSLLNTVSTSASSKTPQNPMYTPSSSAVSDPYIPPTRSSSHNPEQVKRRCLDSNYQLPVTAKNLPPQQGIAQTSNTSAPNRTNETFEGSGRAKKNDSGVLLEEYVSSSDEIHSNQQRTTQTQKQKHAPFLQTPDFQNQQSYDLPIQTRQCSEVMQCLQHFQNKRIYGDIHFVTPYQSAGVGSGQIGHLPAKFRITFPEAFKALTKEQMMNMRVEGNLTLNQSKLVEYVQQTSEGTLNNLLFQKAKGARDIPICLQATALIDEANRKITPETQQILTHIQSLFTHPVTADIILFFNQHQGGIARHYDEASGISTRFLFRLPDEQFKNIPVHELKDQYTKLQAQVNELNEDRLKNYVLALGSEVFMRDLTIHRIMLRSSEVSFLPNESQQQ